MNALEFPEEYPDESLPLKGGEMSGVEVWCRSPLSIYQSATHQ